MASGRARVQAEAYDAMTPRFVILLRAILRRFSRLAWHGSDDEPVKSVCGRRGACAAHNLVGVMV